MPYLEEPGMCVRVATGGRLYSKDTHSSLNDLSPSSPLSDLAPAVVPILSLMHATNPLRVTKALIDQSSPLASKFCSCDSIVSHRAHPHTAPGGPSTRRSPPLSPSWPPYLLYW